MKQKYAFMLRIADKLIKELPESRLGTALRGIILQWFAYPSVKKFPSIRLVKS